MLEYDAVFSHEIVGIYAPNSEIEELKRLYNVFKEYNDLYRFFIFVTSSRILIGRATALLKRDLDNLPYPEIVEQLKLSEVERIIVKDVLTYYKEKDYSKLLGPPSEKNIEEYQKVFCNTLNSIYHTNNTQFQPYKILHTDNYFAVHFEYSEETITLLEEQIVNIEQYIQEVIPQRDTNQQHIHIQKIMKVYGRDSIILVKPKQLRYWLPSIALRDADEVFADYVKARYQDA